MLFPYQCYGAIFFAAVVTAAFSAHVLAFPVTPVKIRHQHCGHTRSTIGSCRYACFRTRSSAGIVGRFMAGGDEDGSQPQPPSPFEGDPQSQPTPTTFREGEVIGLRFMQEGEHEKALKGV